MKPFVWFGFVLNALSATGDVFLSQPGSTAIIKCGISANDIGLQWKRENNLVVVNDERFGTRRGKDDIAGRSQMRQTELHITRVKEEDAGKFTCFNEGKQRDHTLLVVSVSATPSDKLKVGDAVTLDCKVKGLNPKSTIQWKSPNAGMVANPFGITSVSRSDAATWKCTFSHGESTLTVDLNIIVEDPPPQTSTAPPKHSNGIIKPGVSNTPANGTPKLELKWWMWLAIASGCLVVILLTVFVIVLCKRLKRKKKRFQRMKKSNHLMGPKKYCQCNRLTAAPKPQQGRRGEKPSAPPLPLVMEGHERLIEERRDRQKERKK